MPNTWKTERSFYDTRDILILEEKLFTDDEFPMLPSAEDDSCMWIRPSVLINSPVFATESTSRRTFLKGALSAPCFGVVADILLSKGLLWSHVVAQDQSFSHDYSGMFLFRFWRQGITVPVIIDDVLPFDPESKVFMLTSFLDAEDLWCTLLEKAYAKFLGGFEYLASVSLATVMTDILGCSVHLYPKKALTITSFKLLRNIFEMKSIAVGLSCDAKTLLSISENKSSISPSSLYVLTSLSTHEAEDLKTEWFLRLRDPFSIQLEQGTGYSETDILNVGSIVTLTLKEFSRLFTNVYLGLPRTPGLYSDQSLSLREWEMMVITGKWTNSRELNEGKYNSPLVRIKVTKPDCIGGKKLCTLIVSLMQYCIDAEKQAGASAENMKSSLMEIGIKVLSLTNKESKMKRLPTGALSMTKPVVKSVLYLEREICAHLCLQPGEYVIVPETKQGNRFTLFKQRYSLTLYSIEPITLMNGGPQKYGLEYLHPIELNIIVPKYVTIGHSIKISVKISNFPPKTRYTITMLLTFNRTSDDDPHEKVVKARLEYVEVCRDLTDKELTMQVHYNDYIRFPLEAEVFIVRCSALIHELSLEVRQHCTIQTILPKIKLTIERDSTPGTPLIVFPTLYNTLPVTIPSARFCVYCKLPCGPSTIWGSVFDVPPFSTVWLACSLCIREPSCSQIKTFFVSSYFHRSVSVSIPVVEGDAVDVCPPPEEFLLLGQPPKMARKTSQTSLAISCCNKHKGIAEVFPITRVKSTLFRFDDQEEEAEEEAELSAQAEESLDGMTYCSRKKDLTPESELPPDIVVPSAMII